MKRSQGEWNGTTKCGQEEWNGAERAEVKRSEARQNKVHRVGAGKWRLGRDRDKC